MNKFKILFIFSIFFLVDSLEAKEPSLLIEEIVDEASTILSSPDPVEAKIIKLNNIAEKNADINGKLFKRYFLKSFSSRLVDYSDPKISIVSKKKLNDKYTIVSTVLEETSKNPEVKIDWRIYTKNPERPLIRDLIVEGLSLARTQKEEFNSIIQNNNGDINFLFKSLEEFIIK